MGKMEFSSFYNTIGGSAIIFTEGNIFVRVKNVLLLVNCPCHQPELDGFSNESFPFAKTVVCLRTTGTAVGVKTAKSVTA
ncbi:hypothetical protein [Brevibacillus parabrevis]|uniref:hypothetical protein n=1 Tax=Brevibacillus parabrevis TaxID=54914 RepID=UPI002E1FFBA0|nr:hypothetical protein [Brevibacillus parabrevis]